MLDYTFAVAWTIAALNRWGYIDMVQRKVLLLSLVDDSLMNMLESIRRGAGLDLSLEERLAEQLAQNPDDEGKKGQLKIIRLCKTLGAPRSSIHLVLGVVVAGLLNELHHALTGSGDK